MDDPNSARPPQAPRPIQIVVQVKPGTGLPYADGLESHLDLPGSDPSLESMPPQLHFTRLFPNEPETTGNLEGLESMPDPYAPTNFYVATYSPDSGQTPEEWIAALKESGIVETAYIERPSVPAAPPPIVAPAVQHPGHLHAGPRGVNAIYAWNRPGGTGAGVHVIDVEHGWYIEHPALLHSQAKIVYPPSRPNCAEYVDHGTQALGVICARDPGGQVYGIAPDVRISLASCCDPRVPRATIIREAGGWLQPGDILVIEVQTPVTDDGDDHLPVETWPSDFSAIYTLTQRGIIVVEAAGNGKQPLDAVRYDGEPVLQRGYRDSGAILVAAAYPDLPHERWERSNHGSRIDCYAWGAGVTTCGWDEANGIPLATSTFRGTSSATAIIGGVAAVVQSLTRQMGRPPWSPTAMRKMLSAPENGTPAGLNSPGIGVMPDLEKIINNVLS